MKNKTKLKVGDVIYSKFFGKNIVIVMLESEKKWWFRFENNKEILEAHSPLSCFDTVLRKKYEAETRKKAIKEMK